MFLFIITIIIITIIIIIIIITIILGTMASAPEYDLHAPVIEFNTFSSIEDDQDDSYACCTISLKLTRRYNAFCIRIVVPCAMISAIRFITIIITC